jgi:hypothetical protein
LPDFVSTSVHFASMQRARIPSAAGSTHFGQLAFSGSHAAQRMAAHLARSRASASLWTAKGGAQGQQVQQVKVETMQSESLRQDAGAASAAGLGVADASAEVKAGAASEGENEGEGDGEGDLQPANAATEMKRTKSSTRM